MTGGENLSLLTEMFPASGMCRNKSMSQFRIPRLFADEPNWCTLQSTSHICRCKYDENWQYRQCVSHCHSL